MKKILSLILLSYFLIANTLNLSEDEKQYLDSKTYLNVMSVDKFYPFTFLQNGEPSGYTVDVMKLMGEYLNKELKFITNPWEVQLQNIQNGSLDIMPYVVKTKERENFIDFTDYTHITFLIGFATNKNNQIDTMKELSEQTVAVVKDSFMYGHLKNKFPNITILATSSVQESLEAVVQNKAYATLDNINTLDYLIKEGWLNQLKIITVDDLGLPHSNQLHMGVQKGNKLLKSILEKTNKAILPQDIEQIKIKWFKNVKDTQDILKLTEQEIQYLENKPYLTSMSLQNFQPFSFVQNGTPNGYSVETMKLIGKVLNKDIKFIKKPWGEQLEMLKNGKLDVIPHIAVNEKRKKFVDYTNFSHLTFLIGFAINKNSDISSMADFKGKKIAVVNKYYLHDHLKKAFPNIELMPVSSTQEAVEAVAKNKAFAVIDNIPTLNYFIQEKWLTNLKIDTVDDLDLPLETQMPMGVTKGNLVLKSILEKANSSILHADKVRLRQNWINLNPIKDTSSNLTSQEQDYLKKKKKILMCVLPDWLPFEQIDENGRHKGIGADFMKLVSKYIDTPIELLPTKEWSKSLQNIKERKCDILPVAMDIPSRREHMNFTKPYVAEPFVVATKQDKLFIKNTNELSEKKIGIVKSYAFIEVLKSQNPDIKIIDVKNTKEGLEKVQKGELYGYIDTMPTIGYFIQKHSMLDLKIAGKLEFDIKLSVASRNDEPILNTIMQKAMDSISAEQKRTIVGKWIEIKVAQEFDYMLLWQVIFVFFIIIAAILYRNREINIINAKIEEQQKMVDKYVLILTTDLKGVITDVNDAYCNTIGYSKDELLGKRHSMIKHHEMKSDVFEAMWSTLESDNVWQGEVKNLTKLKETVWFFINIEPIFKDNKKIGYRSISEDITDKKKIEILSITDQLTQLYNRLKLEEVFKIEMKRAERYGHSLSVILLDIDHFKSVNDNYGHDIGDETLISVAQVLEKSVRQTDTIGRWGGEEFIILAPDTDLEHTIQLANKIRKNMEAYTFNVIGKKTASFGVSTLEPCDTRQSLVKKADEALYKAKENGRNRVEVYPIS